MNCGDCSACCIWGEESLGVRPILTEDEADNLGYVVNDRGQKVLPTDGLGRCRYLGANGCTIHAEPRRPRVCQLFDCRDLYVEVMAKQDNAIIRVAIQGGLRVNR